MILFGLPRPLPAGTVVAPADPPAGPPGRTSSARVPLLRTPAWLYWLDLDPYARFSHPSRWLLVDDATGKIVRRGATEWYPAVNGERPAFLRGATAYEARAFRVFARTPSAPRKPSAARAGTTRAAGSTVPAGAFAGDCLLLVGDFDDDEIGANDWPAMQGWAASVGLRSWFASPKGPRTSLPRGESPSGADVNASVDALVASGCKDILIFASGHGRKADAGPPTVVTGLDIEVAKRAGTDQAIVSERTRGFTAADMEGILEEHPGTTFKLKIDSCFSGRFLDQLLPGEGPVPANGNLLIVEVSSQATKVSYTVPDYLLPPEHKDLEKSMGGFTRQNVVGLRTWAASEDEVKKTLAQGGSLLARALERAFELGRGANRHAERNGVKPRVRTNYPLPQPLGAAGTLSRTGTTASLALANTGRDPIRCWQLTLPAGVLATGISTPPASWQLGSSQPPPAPTIGGRTSQSGIPAGATQTFGFTTNVALTAGSTLKVSADCSTDAPAPVTGP